MASSCKHQKISHEQNPLIRVLKGRKKLGKIPLVVSIFHLGKTSRMSVATQSTPHKRVNYRIFSQQENQYWYRLGKSCPDEACRSMNPTHNSVQGYRELFQLATVGPLFPHPCTDFYLRDEAYRPMNIFV